MKNTVVIGAQWGDEGKAKITDILAEDADFIVRFQGGCNAGHTVVYNNKTYKFHLVPSGILYKDKVCFLGNGVVIHPETFEKEIDELKSQDVDLSGLKISPLATLTMPYHIDIDGLSEKAMKSSKIGTTKKGIGPTYSDKIARIALKVQDLFCDETLEQRLDVILPLNNFILEKVHNTKTYTKEEVLNYCKKYKQILEPYVCFDWQNLIREFKNKKILFEGAQGVMLDVDWGTYPYVTSSNTISGYAACGSGFSVSQIDDVIGVYKAYVTRVGEGPFVTELLDKDGETIQQKGNEFGTTTGRKRRTGWFDAVCGKYTALVGGVTKVALTKLDVFDDFEKIKIAIAYKDKRDGKLYKDYPTNTFIHKYLEPVYETYDGWMKKTSDIKDFEDLPKNAKKYIKKIEELLEVPVCIISVGADRTQTIYR